MTVNSALSAAGAAVVYLVVVVFAFSLGAVAKRADQRLYEWDDGLDDADDLDDIDAELALIARGDQ